MWIGFGALSCFTNVTRTRWAEEEIADFLSHLASQRHVSASTQNQAFSALARGFNERGSAGRAEANER